MIRQASHTKRTKKKSKEPKDSAESLDLNLETLDSLIGFHLKRSVATIMRDYNRRVLGGEIRPALASLMRLVATNPGASQIALSRALAVDKATLVGMLDTAERHNWLARKRSSIDRRRHEIVVTPEGQKVVDELVKQMARMERTYQERFTAEEFAKLIEYLQRIYRYNA